MRTQYPKRILALDGGGVRGIISIAFLERIEALAREAAGGGAGFRLRDWFDLVGGTSTRAIIATMIALGRTAPEIRDRYFDLAPHVFRRSWWRVAGLQPRFDERRLRAKIDEECGERTLESPDLKTLLAVITKRADTGSPWIVTNNPNAPYWKDPADGTYIGNRHFSLAALVRASAAAPYFFAPQPISIVSGQPPGMFVDGGVSPFNNPSLALLMHATMKSYGLGWPLGKNNLTFTSIGTGSFRNPIDFTSRMLRLPAPLLVNALVGLIRDSQEFSVTLMHWLSDSAAPWPINAEIGDLSTEVFGGQPLLSFQRYDVHLERRWLEATLGRQFSQKNLLQLQKMEDPANIRSMYEMATLVAQKMVKLEHFLPDTQSPIEGSSIGPTAAVGDGLLMRDLT
jgi:uncharacterized protein